MELGDFIRFINLPYSEEELVPASTIQTIGDQEKFKQEHGIKVPLYQDVISLCYQYEINPEYFYIAPSHQDAFVYYHFPVFLSMPILNQEFFEVMRMKERIEINERIMQEAFKKQEYMKIVSLANDNAKVLVLNKLYWMVMPEKRYQLWKEIYQYIDFGHALMDQRVIQDAINNQPKAYRDNMLKKLSAVVPGDLLTVYRGIGKASTDPSQSMSWTISLPVASYFASRYEKDGKIYQATIHKDHVIDYLTNRREEEILLKPEYLQDIQQLSMFSLQEEMDILLNEGYMNEYCLYRNTYIKEEDYLDPHGIHGIPHVKRVLYHCIATARHLALDSSERAILALSSIFHDIGRIHDERCTEHGKWSWKKLQKKIEKRCINFLTEFNYVEPYERGEDNYHLRLLTEEEQKMVQFIVEYHCRDDEEAKRDLKKFSFIHKEKAWKLYEIFKDCDGLDRVRLSKYDLDVSYLRTDIAKKRVLVAYSLPHVKQL